MAKLSVNAKRDYDEELKVIRETGSLRHGALFAAILLCISFGPEYLSRDPSKFNKHDFGYGVIAAVCYPFASRAWERYRVAAIMRHQREIRIETKLDALLGLLESRDDRKG